MELVRGIGSLRERHQPCVLSIGNYDGVHLGHRAVLGRLGEVAAEHGLPATVMVFEPTPREYFAPQTAPARLTNLREKIVALAPSRIDRVICVHFDADMAAMEPEAFIDSVLVDALGVRHLIVGDDFRFGHARRGDYAMLVAAAPGAGFGAEAMGTFELDGERVSSTAVRAALARHDLAGAQRLLGRRYSMIGRVVRGQRLGSQLGFPTANIPPGRRVLPLHGVFAVEVRGAAVHPLPGVASLGTRPTVDGRDALLEVHLFDFDRSLYGEVLEVRFVAWLREERHYDDLPAMVAQMHHDARRAREILGVGRDEA